MSSSQSGRINMKFSRDINKPMRMNLTDYVELLCSYWVSHDFISWLGINLLNTHWFVNYHFGTRGQMRGGNYDWIWLRTRRHATVANLSYHKVAIYFMFSFIVYFILNDNIIYEISIMLYLRRSESSTQDYKHIKKMFTEVINQVRSTVIIS